MPSRRPGPVVVYASDHGFGHAARMLALSAHLSASGLDVTLCVGAAAPMIRAAVPHLCAPSSASLDVARASLDPGLVASKGALDFDLERSREALSDWLSALPHLVESEASRLSSLGASLVVADVPAAAILAADRAGVPSVVCSNFTWLDMYAGRFGSEIDAALAGAYALARLGLRPMLGRLPLAGVGRVRDVDGLLARRPLRPRAEVRRELGVAEDALLIGLGLGGSLDAALYDVLASSAPASDVRLLAPVRDGEPPPSARSLASFPAITPDPQSYFGACDLVLAKAGYSTLAEAAIAGVPLAVFALRKSPESRKLAADVAALGLGVELADDLAAIAALSNPRALIESARLGHRGARPDAAPGLLRALVEENLLPGSIV
jgi:L-arabinokinase